MVRQLRERLNFLGNFSATCWRIFRENFTQIYIMGVDARLVEKRGGHFICVNGKCDSDKVEKK